MENSFSDRLYILDGGMGTMLQKAGAGAGENTVRDTQATNGQQQKAASPAR